MDSLVYTELRVLGRGRKQDHSVVWQGRTPVLELRAAAGSTQEAPLAQAEAGRGESRGRPE